MFEEYIPSVDELAAPKSMAQLQEQCERQRADINRLSQLNEELQRNADEAQSHVEEIEQKYRVTKQELQEFKAIVKFQHTQLNQVLRFCDSILGSEPAADLSCLQMKLEAITRQYNQAVSNRKRERTLSNQLARRPTSGNSQASPVPVSTPVKHKVNKSFSSTQRLNSGELSKMRSDTWTKKLREIKRKISSRNRSRVEKEFSKTGIVNMSTHAEYDRNKNHLLNKLKLKLSQTRFIGKSHAQSTDAKQTTLADSEKTKP